WIERHGRWIFLRKRHVDKASKYFDERGGIVAVFVSQLLPGVRGLIALPAGFAEMNWALFLLANFAGTIIWCAALAYAGQVLRANYERVDKYLGPVGWGLLALVVVAGTVWAVRRRRRKRD